MFRLIDLYYYTYIIHSDFYFYCFSKYLIEHSAEMHNLCRLFSFKYNMNKGFLSFDICQVILMGYIWKGLCLFCFYWMWCLFCEYNIFNAWKFLELVVEKLIPVALKAYLNFTTSFIFVYGLFLMSVQFYDNWLVPHAVEHNLQRESSLRDSRNIEVPC